MDAERFDRLARALTFPRGRRAFGQSLAAAIAGGAVLVPLNSNDADAKKRKRRRKKNKKKHCDAGALRCNGTCCLPGQVCLGALLGCANGGIAVGATCDPALPGACVSGTCGCDGDDCFCRLATCYALGAGCLVPVDCCTGACPGATSMPGVVAGGPLRAVEVELRV